MAAGVYGQHAGSSLVCGLPASRLSSRVSGGRRRRPVSTADREARSGQSQRTADGQNDEHWLLVRGESGSPGSRWFFLLVLSLYFEPNLTKSRPLTGPESDVVFI